MVATVSRKQKKTGWLTPITAPAPEIVGESVIKVRVEQIPVHSLLNRSAEEGKWYPIWTKITAKSGGGGLGGEIRLSFELVPNEVMDV